MWSGLTKCHRPPLVPDDSPIDIGHLRHMTLNDVDLEREVLAVAGFNEAITQVCEAADVIIRRL